MVQVNGVRAMVDSDSKAVRQFRLGSCGKGGQLSPSVHRTTLGAPTYPSIAANSIHSDCSSQMLPQMHLSKTTNTQPNLDVQSGVSLASQVRPKRTIIALSKSHFTSPSATPAIAGAGAVLMNEHWRPPQLNMQEDGGSVREERTLPLANRTIDWR